MNKALLLSTVFCVLTASSNSANAQQRSGFFHYKEAKQSGVNLKKWWAIEGTIGAAITTPVIHTEELTFSSSENAASRKPDTIVAGSTAARPGLHVNISSSHQLVRLSPASMISFSAGVDGTLIQSSFGTTYAGTREVRTRMLHGAQIGAPITLEYKWGCDVDFDPYVPVCFAVGGGAMPAITYAVHGAMNDMNFRVAPYAYASLGFYAGGCWKLRAAYTPGNMPLMKEATKDHQVAVSRLTVNTQNVMTIGVTRMLRSKDWRTARAWRGGRNGASVAARMF